MYPEQYEPFFNLLMGGLTTSCASIKKTLDKSLINKMNSQLKINKCKDDKDYFEFIKEKGGFLYYITVKDIYTPEEFIVLIYHLFVKYDKSIVDEFIDIEDLSDDSFMISEESESEVEESEPEESEPEESESDSDVELYDTDDE